MLLTLYSLTDTSVEEPVLVRAFLKRLSDLEGMDTTRNLYEEALRRLTDSMVQMIEQNGRKRIGVCNPSINDFLKNYIRENPMEQANMPAYATEYVQLERICPGCVEELVRNGRIYQKQSAVKFLELFAITAYGICVIWSSCRHSWRNRGAATPKKEIEAKKSCSLCCRKKWTCSIIQERN